MYFLGYDIGSSSIKIALLNASTNKPVAVLAHPKDELSMTSTQSGWAEQDPESWWDCAAIATKELLVTNQIDPADIKGIGIAYQMHGLVVVDHQQNVLRPSIIWCDSRAVSIGEEAFHTLGHEWSFSHLLNSPGNFTASKLKWVRDNEPQLFDKIHKMMLPGDYIAMKMTGQITTTIPGLSEGMFWDFNQTEMSNALLDHFGINKQLIPDLTEVFGVQGYLTKEAAEILGLREGVPVAYRSGDQPNNAMALGVLAPGQVAATGGTSGVVYGVSETPIFDVRSRINSFAHVNYKKESPVTGALLCINGAGIQYRWIKEHVARIGMSYNDLECLVEEVTIGSDGLCMLPFGNGAERMLESKGIGASLHGLNFNVHKNSHLVRAALEGIAFAFVYGIEILNELGLNTRSLRVGNDNLFRSATFSKTIASLTNSEISVLETTGAIGAARGAAYGLGHFNSLKEAMSGDNVVRSFNPEKKEPYQKAYDNWKNILTDKLKAT